MKNLFPVIFLLISSVNIFSQNTLHNLEKYWHYRDKLEHYYMILGEPEKQGTNIPASNRHYLNYNGIQFGGENPIKYDFGPYLAVLATEYRLLKDYGQNTDAAQTLQKIAWALYAFDRIDMNTEKFFRAKQNGLADNDPYFWTKVDTYIHPSEDLNGFFMRGDADGTFDYLHHDPDPEHPEDTTWWTLDYFNNRVYPYNLNANLLAYKDSQLVYDDMIYKTSYEKKISAVSCRFQQLAIESKNKSVMSGDEVIGLFIGLVFLKKYVHSSQKFTDILGRQVTIEQWVNNIFYRVMLTVYHNGTWHMKNPVTGERIRPGDEKFNSYAFSKIAFKYFGYFYPSDFLNLYIGHLFLSYNYGWRMTGYIGAYNNTLMLSAMADIILPLSGFKKNHFGFFQYLYQSAKHHFQIPAYEYFPLLFAEMNDISVKDKWDDDLYDDDNPYTANDYKADIEHLLNMAPDCGPYLFNTHSIPYYPNDYWFKNRFWPGGSRFIKIDRDVALDPAGEIGYKNGLDYMLLHNLYWLQFMNPASENVIVEQDFPFYFFWHETGSHYHPKTIYSKNYISADNTIDSEGDVTYIAGESITLNPGFETKYGADFKAVINPNLMQPDYKYHYFKPVCYYWNYNLDKDISDFNKIDTSYKYSDNFVEEQNFSKVNIEKEKFSLSVYPNPFNDIISINLGFNNTGNISIFDIYGKVVYSEYVVSYKQIDLSFLRKGLYIIKAENNNKIISTKIVKK